MDPLRIEIFLSQSSNKWRFEGYKKLNSLVIRTFDTDRLLFG